MEDEDRRRGARGAGARPRSGATPSTSSHRREAAPRFSYWRTGAVFRSALGADRGGAPRHQGQGARRAGLRAPRRQAARRASSATRTIGSSAPRRPDEYAASARRAVAMGFSALKWDPFESAWLEMDRAQRRRTIEIVEAVRDAVGPDIDLMLDVHGRLNVPTAIAMTPGARALRSDLDRGADAAGEHRRACRSARNASPVPIAAGER